MLNIDDLLKVPTKCYENGKRVILLFAAAYVKLWAANYGWVVPIDWYRWCIEVFADESEIFRNIKGKAMRIGYIIHTQEMPLTLEQVERFFNGGETLGKDTFATWVCRFHSLLRKSPNFKKNCNYEKYYPFYYIDLPNGRWDPIPAYKRYEERSYFVIAGVDPDSDIDESNVDWSVLKIKPEQEITLEDAMGCEAGINLKKSHQIDEIKNMDFVSLLSKPKIVNDEK